MNIFYIDMGTHLDNVVLAIFLVRATIISVFFKMIFFFKAETSSIFENLFVAHYLHWHLRQILSVRFCAG